MLHTYNTYAECPRRLHVQTRL